MLNRYKWKCLVKNLKPSIVFCLFHLGFEWWSRARQQHWQGGTKERGAFCSKSCFLTSTFATLWKRQVETQWGKEEWQTRFGILRRAKQSGIYWNLGFPQQAQSWKEKFLISECSQLLRTSFWLQIFYLFFTSIYVADLIVIKLV